MILTLILLFTFPLLAGLGVMYFKPLVESRLKLLLSFSASFLLAICFVHLLPEAFESGIYAGYFVLCGFFIQILLEFFSAGIEHGHIHRSSNRVFPYLVFLSLCIHSIIEGFPLAAYIEPATGRSTHSNALLVGILLHKIPIGIVLVSLLLEKGVSSFKIALSLIIFSLTAPLSIISTTFSITRLPWVNPGYLTAISIGIFLHISTVILFESAKNHQFNLIKFLTVLMGILMAVFIFGSH